MPVQIVFAGKAHPADDAGKRILQQVFNHAIDPDFEEGLPLLKTMMNSLPST